MAAQPYKFLRRSIRVFKVLAWVALAAQLITGFILIVTGGEPVFIGGLELPARVVGLLNCVGAVVYFFSFWFLADLVRLWLEIRERLERGS